MGQFKAATETARGNGKYQGMNWITQVKRLAIYLRDGMACAYCGDSVENGTKLSLDHILPHSKGGTNHETNLVTCCSKCNSSRGNRDIEVFVPAVAQYINHGVTAGAIFLHIANHSAMDLKPFIAEAKVIIARRGDTK